MFHQAICSAGILPAYHKCVSPELPKLMVEYTAQDLHPSCGVSELSKAGQSGINYDAGGFY